jgi:hypothetical protein
MVYKALVVAYDKVVCLAFDFLSVGFAPYEILTRLGVVNRLHAFRCPSGCNEFAVVWIVC